MNFPDDIAADLPAPRDDEPESLRRDIVDELADHLQCSLNRELLASSQPSRVRESRENNIVEAAWQQVLARFGPPAQIARQLWFDAMKERIMTQKLTAAMAIVVGVAGFLMCWWLWSLTIVQAHLQQTLMEQNAHNATMMEELKSMLQSSSTAASNAGWARLQVKLQSESAEPVSGRVRVWGTAINAGNDNEIDVRRTADESGIADLGLLPFGNYEMEVVATDLGERHQHSFMLSPNSPGEVTIVCPTEPPPEIDASFVVDVPEPLHADRLVFLAYFERAARQTSAGWWNLESYSNRSYTLLFDADGRLLGEVTDQHGAEENSGGFGSGAPDGFEAMSRQTRVEVIELELGPARSIRQTDRCFALSVAARVAGDAGQGTGLRVIVPPEAYEIDPDSSAAFGSSDPDAATRHFDFNPPLAFWEQAIAAFRRAKEVSDVTIPDGWKVVQVPVDVREMFSANVDRSRFARGRSGASSIRSTARLEIQVALSDEEPPLSVGFGTAIHGLESSQVREAMGTSGLVDIDVLADLQLAEAIELARQLGELRAVRTDEQGGDDSRVNQKTLEKLRERAQAKNE